MNLSRTLIGVMIFIFSTGAQSQGFYWESTVTSNGGNTHVMKNYMVPHLFKIEDTMGNRTSMVVNLDKKMFVTINDAKKEYSETSFESMEARMKEFGAMSDAHDKQVEEEMNKLSDLQRKKFEEMMGAKAPGKGAIEVKKTTEKKSILGYECTKTEVRQADKVIFAVWTTKSVKGFENLRADWKEFSHRMAAQVPGKLGKAMAEGLKQAEGFPMETDRGTSVSRVTKLEPRAIPASVFAVPSGYKKVADELFGTPSK